MEQRVFRDAFAKVAPPKHDDQLRLVRREVRNPADRLIVMPVIRVPEVRHLDGIRLGKCTSLQVGYRKIGGDGLGAGHEQNIEQEGTKQFRPGLSLSHSGSPAYYMPLLDGRVGQYPQGRIMKALSRDSIG
ncbi:hypothetical protein [Steroidobacter agaridevorans]|uniref:hypothetical protein n=1 Tax=Steroidobacter agaridevorans TaxID=2695856 RepID=UPI00137A198C|nr:hypothetical protein [Steroidobacter agaridevorans]